MKNVFQIIDFMRNFLRTKLMNTFTYFGVKIRSAIRVKLFSISRKVERA